MFRHEMLVPGKQTHRNEPIRSVDGCMVVNGCFVDFDRAAIDAQGVQGVLNLRAWRW
jgi:hypothetical protein